MMIMTQLTVPAMPFFVFGSDKLLFTPSYVFFENPRRISADKSGGRHILCHNASGGDDRTVAHRHAL